MDISRGINNYYWDRLLVDRDDMEGTMVTYLKDILTGMWILGVILSAITILIGLIMLIMRHPIFLVPTLLGVAWGIGHYVRTS